MRMSGTLGAFHYADERAVRQRCSDGGVNVAKLEILVSMEIVLQRAAYLPPVKPAGTNVHSITYLRRNYKSYR